MGWAVRTRRLRAALRLMLLLRVGDANLCRMPPMLIQLTLRFLGTWRTLGESGGRRHVCTALRPLSARRPDTSHPLPFFTDQPKAGKAPQVRRTAWFGAQLRGVLCRKATPDKRTRRKGLGQEQGCRSLGSRLAAPAHCSGRRWRGRCSQASVQLPTLPCRRLQ